MNSLNYKNISKSLGLPKYGAKASVSNEIQR